MKSSAIAYTKLSPQENDEEHQQKSSKASAVDDHVYYRPKKSAAAKKKRSCLKIFLYIVLITFSIILFLSIAIGTYGYYVLKQQVQRFTVTEPLVLPIEPIPQVELELVKDRAKLFYDTIVHAGQIPTNDLTVTADEINGFIAASDYFAGNAHVNISKNKLAFELSLPVDGILPGGKGRYFVATGYDSIQTLEDGKNKSLFTTQLETLNPVEGLVEGSPLWLAQLLVFRDDTKKDNDYYGGYVINVEKAQFLNWFVPQDYIDQHENILDHVHEICDDNPEMAEMIERLFNGIGGISIGDDAITIHARRSEFQQEDKFPASSSTIQGGSSSSSSSSSDDDSSSSSSDDNRRAKWNYYMAGGGGTRKLLQKLLF